jgi:glyoxylase-like metal-dependent hydrolase (beta-lactamase superfamily II)
MEANMNDLTIHTYTAAEPGLFVNSYLLETTAGVVLIDASLLVSDAQALAARLTALHKPLLAAFVTHAHPDHFNGLPHVVGAHVPVYATPAVADTIAVVAEPKRDQWQPTYGQEWPDRYRVPDHPLDGGSTVEVGGLSIAVYEAGPAESHADSYLVVRSGSRQAAFIGDLAFEGVHSYTADGHTGAWLDQLTRLETDLAGLTLYPGHGGPATVALLADQRRYLLMYREAVRRLAAGRPELDDDARTKLTDLLGRYLPQARLSWMVGLGADAVAAELAADLAEPGKAA